MEVILKESEDRELQDRAFNATVLICQVKREIGKYIFVLGEYLYKIKWDYANLGERAVELYQHPSFECYLAAPEESAGVDIAQSTANRAIRIFETFKLRMPGIEPHAVLACADYSKLDMICGVITEENAEEWLGKAKSLSRADLWKEVHEHRSANKKAKASPKIDCKHDYKTVCGKCGAVLFE